MSVTISTNRHGYLALRIGWQARRFWVGTKTRDDGTRGPNRRFLATRAALIEEELLSGKPIHEALLSVLGDCPPRLMPIAGSVAFRRGVTIREFYAQWIKRKVPPVIRASTAKRHKRAFDAIIIPELGDLPLVDLTPGRLEAFRAKLVAEEIGPKNRRRIRSMKAARNIIDWHLRALWNDARHVDRIVEGAPFSELRWPDVVKPKPDPFTDTERESITAYFDEKQPSWAPWVRFLFWTGMRHGEAAALRWGDVDLERGVVSITKSRDERVEAAPKTSASVREIPLLPEAIAALRKLTRPIGDDGSKRVFLSPEGKPVTDSWWPKRGWYRALTALKIRPRKFYATRHTFISWAASQPGCSLKGLAEYCGTSTDMIQRNYGRFMRSDFLVPLLAALGKGESGNLLVTSASNGDAIAAVSPTYGMEAGGIEPRFHSERAAANSKPRRVVTPKKATSPLSESAPKRTRKTGKGRRKW